MFENDFDVDDYLKSRDSWRVEDGKLIARTGLIFIGTDGKGDYTISTTTTVEGRGYGILLETILDTSSGEPNANRDTGYALQFDPGLGGTYIIMRKRTNGRESNGPIIDLSDYIAGIDLDWMNLEHHVVVEVNEVIEGTKEVIMTIDGNVIDTGAGYTYLIDAAPDDQEVYTGFRTWSGDTLFEDFEYNSN